ncbi:hypothetical protein J3S90_01855 [Flavobacterium sp. P4023]|uniref:Uncharacterized protein n=1 Tax=Flavobacterium flabelliforme TaxID=2816119 RepID=A0ABS5CPI8_9FLAO|nr:hypothetical protein [Flavobacterium flabelliforme]MBP4140542.1 hypothetical protein [Flavobacterium flabelliforme]
MRKIIFIVVLILLIKPILPVLEYVVNYDYISKVLCINKDKPMMHCNGKCHLMKELAKASESEKGKEKHIFFSFENNILFCNEIQYNTPFIFYKNFIKKNFISNKIIYTFSLANRVFRPPLFI